jgi:hypothetical protein
MESLLPIGFNSYETTDESQAMLAADGDDSWLLH